MHSNAKPRPRDKKQPSATGKKYENGDSYGDKRKSRKEGRVNDFSTVRNREKPKEVVLPVDINCTTNNGRLNATGLCFGLNGVIIGGVQNIIHDGSYSDNSGDNKRSNMEITPSILYKEKISIGVACCRINCGKPEVLIVCKRYTYAYNVFVHGRYNSGNNQEIIKLFNEMTIEEKSDIMSLNFNQIWYRIWSSGTQKMSNFVVSKSKFENTFVADRGARLRSLMAKSSLNAQKIWEIPKGKKKNKQENDIHCAVREFNEETGVSKSKYKIFPNKRTYSYIDQGTRYTNIYYIAVAKYQFEPCINFGNSVQLEEVSDIRFANIEEIRLLDKTGRLAKFVKPIFNFIKKNK